MESKAASSRVNMINLTWIPQVIYQAQVPLYGYIQSKVKNGIMDLCILKPLLKLYNFQSENNKQLMGEMDNLYTAIFWA